MKRMAQRVHKQRISLFRKVYSQRMCTPAYWKETLTVYIIQSSESSHKKFRLHMSDILHSSTARLTHTHHFNYILDKQRC